MEKNEENPSTCMKSEPGRPRTFDTEERLERALEMFLRKGYEMTSLTDLTTTMGINKPSLYAAYGNKEDLFIHALTLYHGRYVEFTKELFARSESAYETIREWLDFFIGNYKSDASRCGCLIVNSASLAGASTDKIRDALKGFHDLNERILKDFFSDAKEKGQLPEDSDPRALSCYFNALIQGMAVIVRSQKAEANLDDIVKVALGAWPGSQPSID